MKHNNEVESLAKDDWEVVIGLEVHAQIASKTKLFSRAQTSFGSEPNSNVSFVDCGMPGMLPTLNRYCVEQAVKTAHGLKAKINLESAFDRKNYFYPDLPQGYQITQFYSPIAVEGQLSIELDTQNEKTIRIERLHIEQDAGKLIHDLDPAHSYVDLNRAGVGLMEIVTYPDMRNAEEAKQFMTKLRMLLRYLGTCDGDMEKGSLRADINVSVRKKGEALRTRCEVKNVNSIRFIGQAIDYEVERQISCYARGERVIQQTRLFNPDLGKTYPIRSKEEAEDYRYFPEPDLPPLILTEVEVHGMLASCGELPDDKKKRYISVLGLKEYDASVLISDKHIANYFEAMLGDCDPKRCANWVLNELLGRLNKESLTIQDCPISPQHLAELVKLLDDGKLSGKLAKEVFELMWTEQKAPQNLLQRYALEQIDDTGLIDQMIEQVVKENSNKVAQLSEKPALFGWFVGQVMKHSKGKANPAIVNELLKKRLGI